MISKSSSRVALAGQIIHQHWCQEGELETYHKAELEHPVVALWGYDGGEESQTKRSEPNASQETNIVEFHHRKGKWDIDPVGAIWR